VDEAERWREQSRKGEGARTRERESVRARDLRCNQNLAHAVKDKNSSKPDTKHCDVNSTGGKAQLQLYHICRPTVFAQVRWDQDAPDSPQRLTLTVCTQSAQVCRL
jgi:hypothetical protein